MASVSTTIAAVVDLRRMLSKLRGAQVFPGPARTSMGMLALRYFVEFRPALISDGIGTQDLVQIDELFRALNESSHRNVSKAKCIETCKALRLSLIKLDNIALAAKTPAAGKRSAVDDLILASLNEVCPSAACAYEQALNDLQAGERSSWRGPATDLREALRETLDVLAPDSEVERSPGYKHEPDLRRPSMKQKTRYILVNRGMAKNQAANPEAAVNAIEEGVSGITRSVYMRSNISTHTPTSRDEVVRLHAWVRLVMCELLALPPEA